MPRMARDWPIDSLPLPCRMNLAAQTATPSATPAQVPSATRRKLKSLFTPEQLAELTQRSDWRGAWAIVSIWGLIFASFALLAWHPSVWTWLVALVVIAGRQLALGILQHEGSHGTLFQSRWANEVLTDWLCARPVWQNLKLYRAHHLAHHQHTGTAQDPDMSLHAGYPTSRRSMARKFVRDLTGLTGLKTVYGLMLMDAGVIKWTVSNHIERLPIDGIARTTLLARMLRNMAPMLITNGVLWGLLALSGHAWVYGAWALAYFTPFPLFIRIRSMAEHGCLPESSDMFINTRTTRASWLARLTVAPVHVNHHLEHHVMASVPYFRLPRMHAMLQAQASAEVPPPEQGYLSVLRKASAL